MARILQERRSNRYRSNERLISAIKNSSAAQECFTGTGRHWYGPEHRIYQKPAQTVISPKRTLEAAAPYYIADCHFYHKNLLTEMDNRDFESVEQMNEAMIEKWNKKVHARDEVVILGDLSLGNGKETNEILCRLKGRLYLIRGNHDERYLCSGWHGKGQPG